MTKIQQLISPQNALIRVTINQFIKLIFLSFLLATNLYANEQNSEFNPSAVRGFTANELSGTVYDSVTRLPLEGVTVQLLFDGSLVNSEWLDAEIGGPSSQNVDLNGGYNFVINASAPSGIYTINLIPPSGYQFPSNLIPPIEIVYEPDLGGGIEEVQTQSTPPQSNENSTYFLTINFQINEDSASSSNGVINNHIPLDKTIPPEISSSQLSSNRTIYIDENVKEVDDFSSNENVTWSLEGIDAKLFQIDSASGQLYFIDYPNFEIPLDEDKDNTYLVSVKAEDDFSNISILELRVIVRDVTDDLLTLTKDQLEFILDKDLALTIDSQLRDLSQNSRDSLTRLGTQLTEDSCKKNIKDQNDSFDDTINSNLLKSLETKSFKGNFSDKFYNCENGTINTVSGDYSLIFDKELGSQILLSGSSNEDKYVSDDHLMGRSLGGYIKRTNISRGSGEGKITGLGVNFGFYEALKVNDFFINYYLSGGAGYHKSKVKIKNKVEDIKTSTGYGYIASYAGTALSGVIEQKTFSLRSSLGLDLAVASSSSPTVQMEQLGIKEKGNIDSPRYRGSRWFSEYIFDLKDFKNDSESLEIAPRLFCDDTFKYSSKNCGLGAYVYYKFKDKKDNNLAVRFDHEQTNLIQRTKFRFYQNLNISNVSVDSGANLMVDNFGKTQIEYNFNFYFH